MIERDLTMARYRVIQNTGKEPVAIDAAPVFHDRMMEELAQTGRWVPMLNAPPPRRGLTEWCGIPVQVNTHLPTDMAVFYDATGKVVGVIRL